MKSIAWMAGIIVAAMATGVAWAADIAELERQLEQARKEAPITVVAFVPVQKPAEYFGGYEDWLRQRPEAAPLAPVITGLGEISGASRLSSTATPAAPAGRKRRLP